MLKRVPTVQTKFAIKDFVKSLSRAWYHLYGIPPKKSQLAVIYAQWGLETGLGTYCWNNNIGNVKAVDIPGTVVEYCALNNVWEIVNGKKVMLKPEDPGSWFRSFPTLDLGVEHHIAFLRNKRYKIAWGAIERGNPVEFAQLLKQQGYYTAPEADYIRAMNYHFNVFMNGKTFDAVQQELMSEYSQIDFPSDYTAIDDQIFDVIEDYAEKKERIKLSTNNGLIGSILTKVQNIFGR